MRSIWICAFVPVPALVLACACQGDSGTRSAAGPGVGTAKITLQLGFDRAQAGSMPAGFTTVSGQWSVLEDPSAPSAKQAFAQTGAEGEQPYNLVLQDDVKAAEIELTVKLKAVSGETDQGGGLVWRAKDARNYYIARWNPLEKNLRMYKVIDGERKQLASENVRAEPGWHELKVTAKGDQLRCTFDGRATLSAKDASFREPGKVGLWTKADAVTRFDDLEIRGLDK